MCKINVDIVRVIVLEIISSVGINKQCLKYMSGNHDNGRFGNTPLRQFSYSITCWLCSFVLLIVLFITHLLLQLPSSSRPYGASVKGSITITEIPWISVIRHHTWVTTQIIWIQHYMFAFICLGVFGIYIVELFLVMTLIYWTTLQ